MVIFAKNYIKIVTALSKYAFLIASSLVIALVLLVVQQVIARYLFDSSSVALQELQWHLFAAIISLSIAYSFHLNAHVAVDVLSNYLSIGIQKIISTIGCLSLLPITIALFYFGMQDVINARSFTNSIPIDYYSNLISNPNDTLYSIFAPIENFLRSTVLVGEQSPDPGGLEARWIVRFFFPLGMLLLFFQTIAILFSLFISKENQLA